MEDVQFVIAYDKFTKSAAISLKNQISGQYRCVVWGKKDFLDNEPRFVNTNRLILFNEDLIKENLANPMLIKHSIVPGIDYLVEGRTMGIVFNEDTAPKKLSDILKENWGKYTAAIVGPVLLVGGVPGATLICYLLTLNKKKKIKFKSYMDAADKLAKDIIKNFMDGKLV